MKESNGIIVRKQTLIAKTKRTVFAWVIGASSLIGASVVLMIILVQVLIFNEKVLNEKGKTTQQLRDNITAAKELKGSVSVLNANRELRVVRTSDNTPPLQSVLDALPADANDLALGASLQNKLLNDIPGVRVESVTLSGESAGEGTTEAGGGAQPLSQSFSLSISGTPEALRSALERLERSIRAVDIQTVSATSHENRVTLQMTGAVSYLPPTKVEMSTKDVKG